MFCGITVWAFRGQQMNPNGVLERIQKAAQQDCVQGKNWEEICWMDQWCFWSSDAGLNQTTDTHFFHYLWHVSVYVCQLQRAHLWKRERACVRNSCSIFQLTEKLNKEKWECIWSLGSLRDHVILKPNCLLYIIQNRHTGRQLDESQSFPAWSLEVNSCACHLTSHNKKQWLWNY